MHRTDSRFHRSLTALTLLGVMVLSTCSVNQVGLGAKVDITPPKVKILTPAEDGQYIKGDLVLSGSASDDLGLKKITITYPSAAGPDVNTKLAVSGKKWSITIPTGTPEGLPEGKVNITATATDDAGKITTDTVLVYIDNFAPTVLVTSPLTYALAAADAPQFTDSIDIKGEVYDPSPVPAGAVEVRLLRADGTPVPSASRADGWTTADGTNTFSIRFLLKNALLKDSDDKTGFYYEVRAADLANNQNAYYYHRNDIYDVLPANTIFPAMNEIGQIDQAGKGESPLSFIPFTATASTKGVAKGLADIQMKVGGGRLGNFQYSAISKPKIKFSNFDQSKLQQDNALAPGSVVNGTITPDANGGAIDPKSVAIEFWTPNAVTGTRLVTVMDTDNTSLSDNIELLGFGDSLVFTVNLKNGDTALPPGPYAIKVTATAKGSNPQSVTGDFMVDDNAPILLETAIGTGALTMQNKPFTLQGTAKAGAALNRLDIFQAKDPLSINETTDTPVQTITLTDKPVNVDNPWVSQAFPAPLGDGTYYYMAKLVSVSGKSSSVYRTILFDSTPPVVDVTAPGADSWVSNVAMLVKGTADDGNGTGVAQVRVLVDAASIDHAADSAAAIASGWNLASGTVTWSYSIANLGAEGRKKLWVASQDKAGNWTTTQKVVAFGLDTAAPALVYNKAAVDGKYVPTTITVTGTAQDVNGIKSVDYSTDGGTTFVAILGSPVSTTDNTVVNWTKDLSLPPNEGAKSILLRITDQSDKQTKDTFTVTYDNVAPALDISNLNLPPFNNSLTSNTFEIKGSVTDMSGVKSLEYTIDGGNSFVPIPLTASVWQKSMADIIGSADGQSGTIMFRAYDKADNVTLLPSFAQGPYQFGVDLNNPTLESNTTALSNSYQRTSFTLTGKARDASGVTTLDYSLDGGTSWFPIGGSSVDGTEITWSAPVTVLADGATDGPKALRVRATDKYGKTTIHMAALTVDASPPTLTLTNLTDHQLITTLPFTARGTVTDNGGSGVSKVEYALSDDGVTWSSWSTASAGANWDATPLLSEALGKRIKFRAEDVAGNLTAEIPGTNSLTVNIDTSAPEISDVSIPTGLQTAPFSLAFVLRDSLGLASYTVTQERLNETSGPLKGQKQIPIVGSLTGNPKTLPVNSWGPFPRDPGDPEHPLVTPDGEYEYVITVLDSSGRPATTYTARVTIDTSPPTPPVFTSSPGSFVGDALTLAGTSSDAGSGILTVYFRFDGASGNPATGTLSGTNDWFLTADTSGLGEGPHTVAVWAKDRAGNQTPEVTQSFMVDRATPEITETSIATTDTVYKSSNFTLAGKWTESNKLASIVATYQRDGVATAVPVQTLNPDTNGTNIDWALSAIDVDTDGAGADTGITDGEYVFTITANDIANRSVTLVRTIRIDTTAPTLTLPAAPATYFDTSVTLSGSASDPGTTASGIQKVKYQIGATLADGWQDADGTTNWSKTIDISTKDEVPLTVFFKAVDRADKESSGTDSVIVKIDHLAPRATIVPTGTFVSLTSVDATRMPFAFAGTADDDAFKPSDGTVKPATSAKLSFTKDGGVATDIPLTPVNGAWSWSSSAASLTDGSHDGLYVFTLTVTDEASKTTTAQKVIRIDTTAPSLSIAAPTDQFLVTNTSYTIQGSALDLGVGIGLNDVTYVLTTNGVAASAVSAPLNGSTWSKVLTFTVEGTYILVVTATDKLGNTFTDSPVTFFYDSAKPLITVTSIATTDTVYKSGNFTLAGKWTESNKLASIVATYQKDGVATDVPVQTLNPNTNGTNIDWTLSPIDVDTDSDTDGAGPDTDTDATGISDGEYVFTITATDIANRTATQVRTIRIDTTAPILTPLTPPITYFDTSVTVSGSATDPGTSASGIQKVQYSTVSSTGPWMDADGTTIWSKTIDILTEAEGPLTVYLKAFDRAGKETSGTDSVIVNIDHSAPRATETNFGAALVQSNTDVTFAGQADDATLSAGRLARKAILTYSKNGATATSVTLFDETLATPISGNSDGSWSWTLATSQGDGLYSVVLTVTDIAGKVASVSRTVQIDTTAPTLVVSAPVANEITTDSVYPIAGTSRDSGGVGFDGNKDVEYKLSTDPDSGWTDLPLNGIDWSGSAALGLEGTKTLNFRSTDKLGNQSTQNLTFSYDRDPPTLTETGVGTVSPKRNATFSLSGVASDTNGLRTWDDPATPAVVQVPYVVVDDGTTSTKTTVSTVDGTWTFPFTVTNQNGNVTFTITAEDVVGKQTTLTRIVTIDTTLPLINVDGVISGLNVSTNQVNGLMTFRFSADDSGVGLEKDGNGKYLAYYTIVAHGDTAPATASAAQIAAWTAIDPSPSSVFTFTFDTKTLTDNANYDLWLGVRDAVPGTPNARSFKFSPVAPTVPLPAHVSLAVAQSSDKPLIGFDNLNTAAVQNSDNGLGRNPTILLTLQDDDKVKVSDLEYRIDINNDALFTITKDFWSGNTVVGADAETPDGDTDDKWEDESKWYAFDEAPVSDGALVQAKIKLTGFPQGVFGLQVRVRDNTDAGTWSTIYEVGTNYSWQKSGIVPFSVDFGPPTIKVLTPLAGTHRSALSLTGTSKDLLGVVKVRYTFDGVSSTTVYNNPNPTVSILSQNLVTGLTYIITGSGNTNWTALGAGSPDVGTTFVATGSGPGTGLAKIDPSAEIPFSATIDTAALPTGEYTLQVIATDIGGSDATQQIPITIDKDLPSVSFLQPGASTTLNGTSVKVSGEAADNRKVGAVFLWHGLASSPPTNLPSQTALPSVGNPNGLYNPGDYTQLAGTGVWNVNIDTTGQTSTVADGYLIRVVAVDAIGNVSAPLDRLVTVDQESDRPVIGFSNLNLVTPSRLPAGNVTIIGTVSDDDSVHAKSIQIRLDRNGDNDFDDTNEGWVPISDPPPSNSVVVSWSHEITDMTNQGNRHVQVRAQDIYGNLSAGSLVNLGKYTIRDLGTPGFTTDFQTVGAGDNNPGTMFTASGPAAGTGTVFDYATGYGWNASPSVAFFIDNGPPTLDLTGPTIGQRFNVGQFTVSGSTNDTNGIHKLVVWVDDNDDQVKDAGELTTITGPSTAATAIEQGKTYTVETIGGTDYTAIGGKNIVGDTFAASAAGTGLSGTGTVKASLTTNETPYTINSTITSFSNAAKSVKAVQVTSYDVSNASTTRDLSIVYDPTAPTATFNTPNEGATVNGVVNISGLGGDNYQLDNIFYSVRKDTDPVPSFPADYQSLGQSYSWNFNLNTTLLTDGAYNVRIVAQDKALNNSSASPTVRNLTVSQASDRPVFAVLTLNEAGAAVENLLPASLQISGTVADDDAVDRTKIQIRSRPLPADNASDWTSLGGVTGSWTAGNWTAISGPPLSNVSLATWSHTFLGFTDGQYEFELRAGDTNDAGTWGTYSSGTSATVKFAVDLNLPTGTITTPAQGASRRVTFPIDGTAADASGIKKVSIAYDTGSGYGSETILVNDTNAADGYVASTPWNTTYTVTGSNDGQTFYRVTITDAFDKVRTYEQYFTVDTLAPTSSFLLPASGATLNGSVEMRGTSTDTNSITKVYMKVNNDADVNAGPGNWLPGTDAVVEGWTLLSGTYNWSYRFKSTSLSDGAAKIYIMAEDAAGNRSNPTLPANQLAFTVSQAANLPVITFTTSNNALLDNSASVTGTITDDDGVNTSTLQISFDNGATWRSVSNPGTNGLSVNFSHALSNGAGLAESATPYQVKVKVSDVGEDFVGTDQDIAPVETTSSALGIKKDDADPIAVVSNLDNGLGPVTNLQGAYLSDKITLTGTATDGVGVSKVEARLVGIEAFSDATNTGTSFSTWTWAKTALTLTGSSVNLEVRVTDVNGRATVQAYTLLVDTTKPTLSFDSTALNPDTTTGAYNGTVTFRGAAADNILISKVYYQFAASDPGAPDSTFTGWTLAGSTYSWSAALDTTTVQAGAVDTSHQLWAVAVDGAGNRSDVALATSHLTFTVNQASDQPVITLSAPTASQVFDVNSKAQGTVTDDDGLASVEIRIDRDNNGVYGNIADEGYVTVNSPATISGKSINLEHVLSTLADGVYRLQVRARDTKYATTSSVYNQFETSDVSFRIDTAPPALDLAKITVQDRYPADGVPVTPITANFNGSYVNNDLTLEFNASDASGITALQVALTHVATVDASTDFFTSVSHGLVANDVVYLSATTLPGGVSATSPYYVLSTGLTGDSFQVSATQGGPAQDITSAGLDLTVLKWVDANHVSGVTYTYDLSVDLLGHSLDGNQSIRFRAKDAIGKVTSSLVTLVVDTKEPVVEFTSPSGISSVVTDQAPNINGKAVTLLGSVTDTNLVKAGTTSIVGGQDLHSFTNNGTDANWKFTLDATAFANKSSATANGDAPTSVDLVTDVITLAGHGLAVGDPVGFYSDAPLAGGLDNVTTYYVIAENYSASTFEVSAAKSGSKVNITSLGTNLVFAKAGVTWRYPITVTTFDIAANKKEYKGYVDLDPNGDKPIINVSSPTNGSSQTGEVLINGTYADDDSSTGSVEVAYSTDAGTTYSAPVNSLVNNGSWTASINSTFTLSGTVLIRVIPSDSNTSPVVGDAVYRTIFIDKSAPEVKGWDGSNELTAPDTIPSSSATKRLAGIQQFRVLFKDDDTIDPAQMQVSTDGGSTYKVLSGLASYSINAISNDAGGKKRWVVLFSIDTAQVFADNSGTNSLTLIFKVTDNTFKPAVASIQYAVDNRPPEGTWDTPTPTLQAQAGLYTFSGNGTGIGAANATLYSEVIGQAFDGGATSGIDYVDVYFVKNGKVYDPKDSSAQAGSPIGLSSPVYVQKAFSAGDISGNVLTLDRTKYVSGASTNATQYSVVVDNTKPVRFFGPTLPTGLVDNKLYYAKVTSGNSFLLYTDSALTNQVVLSAVGSGTMEYVVTGVPFTADAYSAGSGATPGHYAMRINKTTELGIYDGQADGDGDGFQESLKNKGTFNEWFAYFNSTNLPDGPMTVFYVVYDQNGNKVLGSADGQIANNPPSVSTIKVSGATLSGAPLKDLGIGNALQIDLTATDMAAGTIDGTKWKLVVSAHFGAKANGDLDLNTVKTAPPLSFYYGSGGLVDFTTPPPTATSSTASVKIDTTYAGFVEGDWYQFDAQATDNDSNRAMRTFYLRIQNNDSVNPAVSLDDLTQANVSTATGHIEEAGYSLNDAGGVSGTLSTAVATGATTAVTNLSGAILPGWTVLFDSGEWRTVKTFAAGTFTFDKPLTKATTAGTTVIARPGQADISGTVTFTGTAWDNSSVSKVEISLDGGTSWIDVGALTETATDVLTGKDYSWSYTVNTAGIDWDAGTAGTQRAKLDRPIKVRATDGAAKVGTLAKDKVTDPTKTVDVVPYITQISRLAPAKTNRSQYGKYPVTQGETGITVSGFNLDAGTTANLYSLPSGGNVDAVTLPISGVTTPYTSFTLGINAASKSGWLRIAVNGLDALNNTDNTTLDAAVYNRGYGNDASGSYSDDRYLMVFKTGDYFNNAGPGSGGGNTTSSSIQYPSMSIYPTTSRLYGAWSDYTTSETYLASAFSDATKFRTLMYHTFDTAEELDVDIATGGNKSVAWLGNNSSDSDYTKGGINVFTSTQPVATEINGLADTATGVLATTQWTRAGFLTNWYWGGETLAHDSMLYQFQSLKTKIDGNNVHWAYYDSQMQSLKYEYKLNTDAADTTTVAGGGTPGENGKWQILDGKAPTTNHVTENSRTVAAGQFVAPASRSTTSGAGEYLSLALDAGGRPVIVYYDNQNSTLRVAWSSAVAPVFSNWKVQNVFSSTSKLANKAVGKHVTANIDDGGYLHIAFWSDDTGYLYYIKSTNAPAGTGNYTFPDDDPTTTVDDLEFVIDASGTSGTMADISIDRTTGTAATRGAYVAYLNSAKASTKEGLKMAYYDASMTRWENLVTPTSIAVEPKKTNIEYKRSGTPTWDAALGYASTNRFELIYLIPKVQ